MAIAQFQGGNAKQRQHLNEMVSEINSLRELVDKLLPLLDRQPRRVRVKNADGTKEQVIEVDALLIKTVAGEGEFELHTFHTPENAEIVPWEIWARRVVEEEEE